ncbi:mechanosensitive ion channel family protein [Jeotgalibacillus sp. HH7-29]|uniref:Mechanosensitive ion channel family protein n=1 Tax=Jeotgalibacillus haloalkalitolerans TaxID=3104292 RepID=A0ABU5KNS7_9BACL|nr:mechanosensitive ion channel family protein [Jeotgalibacillus sp. HH7-29]MDZ5712909.1 mechanosensitive ion channel family protein [Jeotgalibacillus sp. HH7-29]
MFIEIGIVALKLIGILIVYLIVRAIGNRVLSGIFAKYESKENISVGRARTLESLTKNVFGYALLFILIVTILQLVNIDVTALIAGAGIVGLAIGFGAQGLVSDVVTGFFILLEKQIDVGDYITTGEFSGICEEVGLRQTKIRGFDGTLHFVPNREITSMSNHSRGNMRAMIDIGISYDDDIDKAIKVLQDVCDEVAASNTAILDGPNVVGVQELGSSDVVIRVIGQTANMEQWAVERELRKAMKEALDRNGIEIPYPHQVYVQKEA